MSAAARKLEPDQLLPIAVVASMNLRRVRLARKLHLLGERAVHEFLSELVAEHGIANDVDRRLEKYGELDPETVALVGGRHLPEPPLMAVSR